MTVLVVSTDAAEGNEAIAALECHDVEHIYIHLPAGAGNRAKQASQQLRSALAASMMASALRGSPFGATEPSDEEGEIDLGDAPPELLERLKALGML